MARLLALARLWGLVVAVLVLTWALHFRSSFLSFSSSPPPPNSNLDHFYSVLHPLLMVIGFILLSGEAILAHRWLSGWSRGARKSAHLAMQGAALGFGVFGVWAKFKGGAGIVANFYSLHSWMGLACVVLFAVQWVVGFLSFWHRGEGRRTRAVVLPWHVFVGLYTYVLAIATAETGLLEKLTFLQTKRSQPRRSPETTLANTLGISLALLCALVISAAVSPKHHYFHPRASNKIHGCLQMGSGNKSGHYYSHDNYSSEYVHSGSDYSNGKEVSA